MLHQELKQGRKNVCVCICMCIYFQSLKVTCNKCFFLTIVLEHKAILLHKHTLKRQSESKYGLAHIFRFRDILINMFANISFSHLKPF